MYDYRRRIMDMDRKLADERWVLEREMGPNGDAEEPYTVYLLRTNGYDRVNFQTEREAHKKYITYTEKKYFRQGTIDGVLLYRRNKDRKHTILQCTKGRQNREKFEKVLNRFPKDYFENKEQWLKKMEKEGAK